ncbi:DNA mismatch repair protein MSH4 isoform X2 [Nymphaea colorata]|nr:DNA mismatch repair protein MSH4 isoform X2 [Nymphaea colorata]
MESEGGERASIIVGLIENRAKELSIQVGLAAFDLRSASLHLSQYIETSSSYQNTRTLLHFYDPAVIIVPPNRTSADGMAGVSEQVDMFYSSASKVVMARGWFDDTKGATLTKSLAAKELSVGLDIYCKQYYLCLGSVAAIIRWAEAEMGVIVSNHSLMVTFNGSSDHMNIDATSVQNLEIIEPLDLAFRCKSEKKTSLFHLLKTTKTIGGTRLLRANLLQPLKDMETINARLDCLDELMSNEELFFGLSEVLRKFPVETDRVLCHFCFKQKRAVSKTFGLLNARKSQITIARIILLKTALLALPLLLKVLKNAKSFMFCNFCKTLSENMKYDGIMKRIENIIDKDILHARVPFIARTQQCFAVKPGVDGYLDVARRSFCDSSEAIHHLASKYRENFKLPDLKLLFNNRQGFYFSIAQKCINGKLPGQFIQVVKHGKNIHFSTHELASLNVRNNSAAADCHTRTEHCLEALVDTIREDVSSLTVLAEILCLLDMIVNSFAHTISTKPVDRYTRPEFTDNGPLAIDSGRHPIMESMHNEFIPNNIFLSEASNLVIVVGPNMSGKSTYLQQIFTRIGIGDNIECNSSTFMTEMRETAFIMHNVSSRSLIVIDELGRATSSTDGFAVAWSCCEHLLSLPAYTIFATHMEKLTELVTLYPNVKVLHFQVNVKNGRLDFQFRLMDGPHDVPYYGLLLAGVAGLPNSVIEVASNITTKIMKKEALRMEENCIQYHSIWLDYRLLQRLICLKYSNQDQDGVLKALQNLKESYINGKLSG